MRRALALAFLVLVPVVSAAGGAVDQHGQEHRWKGAGDGYTVIDFAASWCRPCWTVLPKLERWSKEHPEVRVLVVDVDDRVKGRDALVEKLGLTIPVVWDEKHEIAEHYRPAGMPATFVLDPAGAVVYSHVGSAPEEWKKLTDFLDRVTSR